MEKEEGGRGGRIINGGVTLKCKARVKSVIDDRGFQIDAGGLCYLLLELITANA
jgi:hypothetical protein